MYERSEEEIFNSMQNDLPQKYEKRQGYFLYDIIKSISITVKKLFDILSILNAKLDVRNLSGDALDTFVYERTGLKRKEATRATGVILVKGSGNIKKGDLFETKGFVKFASAEDKQIIKEGKINILAIQSGKNGNVPSETITKIPITIEGIISVINEKETAGGYDAEVDIDYRNRYYERLREPTTSGNIYHYKRWAKQVNGIGEARIIPIWQGANTVKVIVIGQDRLPTTQEIVDNVQKYIDPDKKGIGEGVAPIGAKCTVVSGKAKNIDIKVKIFISTNYDTVSIKKQIDEKIKDYFAEIAFKKDFLSYAIVGAKILSVEGVLDYQSLTINNITSNLETEFDEVFKLNNITLL